MDITDKADRATLIAGEATAAAAPNTPAEHPGPRAVANHGAGRHLDRDGLDDSHLWILGMVADGLNQRQMQSRLGFQSVGTVNERLGRLKKYHLLRRADGRYFLTPQGREAMAASRGCGGTYRTRVRIHRLVTQVKCRLPNTGAVGAAFPRGARPIAANNWNKREGRLVMVDGREVAVGIGERHLVFCHDPVWASVANGPALVLREAREVMQHLANYGFNFEGEPFFQQAPEYAWPDHPVVAEAVELHEQGRLPRKDGKVIIWEDGLRKVWVDHSAGRGKWELETNDHYVALAIEAIPCLAGANLASWLDALLRRLKETNSLPI